MGRPAASACYDEVLEDTKCYDRPATTQVAVMRTKTEHRSDWPLADGEMSALVRQHDWSATPLGPIPSWPQPLKTIVAFALESPLAMVVLWGPQLIRIYNDAFRPLLGELHPAALGQPAKAMLPNLWEFAAPVYRAVWKGESRSFTRQRLRLDRESGTDEGWFDITYSPVRDEAGAVGGILATVVDATDRVRAETDLREREEWFRAIAEQAEVGITLADADGRLIFANECFTRIAGRTKADLLGRTVKEITHPDDWVENERLLQRTMTNGEPFVIEKRYVRPESAPIWIRTVVSPRRDDAGRVVGTLAIMIDITSRRRAENRLRQSEERLLLALEAGKLAAWDWDLRNEEAIWSAELYRMLGHEVGAVKPTVDTWWPLIHPDDRESVAEVLAKARAAREDYVDQFRLRFPDGSIRWWSARGRFFFDDNGDPVRLVGVVEDATERRTWEERQQTLIAELQHRTRNLLGIVRSISAQTLRASTSLEEFAGQFNARLSALSRVQALLSRDDGYSVKLRELVEGELEAHGSSADDPRVTLAGPDVVLSSHEVQVLTLALHELATNAVKYGCFAQEQARLSVRWSVSKEEQQRFVVIQWEESGVPLPPDARRGKRGFGRQLIERALPYDLGARTSFTFGGDGVRCELRVPLENGSSDPARPSILPVSDATAAPDAGPPPAALKLVGHEPGAAQE
jgi:PAS domain S-box-containing protein